jgi:hypothetical protein
MFMCKVNASRESKLEHKLGSIGGYGGLILKPYSSVSDGDKEIVLSPRRRRCRVSDDINEALDIK